ncbi:MAG TPA: hypothetical protein IAB43_02080 [Candidatus Spyradocola merdavium]|nr:hypothetical protein [Candidatus Spyradocola merdavium]
MEKRKLRNNIFLAVTILLALGAVAMLALPLLRLAFDAVTALLRSWGVLPGIEAVIAKTLQVLLLVLALVLPISLLITLWMYEYLHGLALGRVQRFLKGLSRVPAVLVGLLGNWLISGNAQAHGSIWSMAALLTVMCLPFMISRVDAALRAVPEKYRMAGEALGGRRMAVLGLVVLPQALPQIVRASLRLVERILCEATALLTLMGAVMPDQVLATELFRLAWLGREDAAVLAFGLAALMILLRLTTTRRWRSEGEEANCRYNWW